MQPSLAEQADCLRQQFPLGLFHHALLKNFRRIALFDGHGFLQNDGTGVGFEMCIRDSRYTMPVDEEGQPDYESPDCLDVPRLNRDLNDLFAGREVSLPTYNFITRRSVESGAKIELKKGDVVIMEGLHALNPMIHFPDDTLRSLRVYVSPADVIVDETRGMELSNQYIRLCRRIYRDRDQRGSSEEETIERSRSVNRGERLYIAPFLNNVGVWRVDTLLGYELFIHRRELPEEKELRVVPLSKITRFDIPEG